MTPAEVWEILKSQEPDTLPQLRHLTEIELFSADFPDERHRLSDLLAALPALQRLTLTVDPRETHLLSLPPLPRLRTLTICGGRRLEDLSALAPMTDLESLCLRGARALRDVSPLAGLAALAHLDLSHCPRLESLVPLASLHSLRVLDLSHSRVSDLAPLRALPRLETLRLHNVPLESLDVLRGWSAQKRTPQRTVTFSDLSFTGLYAGQGWLSAAEYLSLRGRWELVEVSPLAEATRLRGLELSRCRRLRHLWPVMLLAELCLLDVRGCDALVHPPAEGGFLDGREAVDRYQRALARALVLHPARSAAEEAWLVQAQARGLLGEPSAAQRGRWSAEASIRALLEGHDPDMAQQGLALLESLGDAELIASLSWGIGIGEGGTLEVVGRHRRMFRHKRRTWLALSLLGLAGRLTGVACLDLRDTDSLLSLAPLRAAGDLRELRIHGHMDLDVGEGQVLGGLSALEVLHLPYLTSLSAAGRAGLARLTRLRELEVSGRDVPRSLWGLHEGHAEVQQVLGALLGWSG